MPPCECGCGQDVTHRYAKGHNPKRPGVTRASVPREKVCERCGCVYTRESVGRQSNKHWLARRFCTESCRREWRAEASQAQRGVVRVVDAKADSGRMRARRMYPDAEPCEVCGAPAERHHRDGNTLNNGRENIAFLCRKHHIQSEDRMAYRRKPMTPERLERKRAQARERTRRYRQRKREQTSP